MVITDIVHILLVEDSEDDYLLISHLFKEIEENRFEVEWAKTYEGALEAAARCRHHVYLLDYQLGQHSGIDLLRDLVALNCSGPIIMLTGRQDRAMDLAAMEAGAMDYLVKDRLSADLLERSIRYALVRKQAQDELLCAYDELEKRVQDRTTELNRANARLQQEIVEHKQAEAVIQRARDELEKRVQDRTVALSVINDLLQLEIEQRKQSEQVLRESEARHRALIDAIPDAMITVRHDGKVLKVKAASGSTFSKFGDRRSGKDITDLLPGSFAERIMVHVEQALATGALLVFEDRLPFGKEGQDIEVRVVVSGDDETLCILRDITERKRADRLKAEFLSVVSHELRTPLTSISGSLALMAAGLTGELPEQALVMINIAHRNSERLVRLINDLLDLQKIESGTMPAQMEPVEMIPLVERVIEANYAYGSRFGVTFELAEGAPDVWVLADADRLMQVLTNLLSNAAKFSPAGSTVTVSVKGRNHAVRVGVADKGPGIPGEYQQHIFKKFVQIDSSSSRQKEGTGLGLSISKAIVEMQGGKIWFESEPGAGATFYFELLEWHEDAETVFSSVEHTVQPRAVDHEDSEKVLPLEAR